MGYAENRMAQSFARLRRLTVGRELDLLQDLLSHTPFVDNDLCSSTSV